MATQTTSTGRESDKFMLRLPDGMRDKLKAAAEENGRTMNSEIGHRLMSSFDPPPTEEIAALRREVEMAKLHRQADRGMLHAANFLILEIAPLIPPAVLASHPDLAATLGEMEANRRKMTLDALEEMVAALHHLPSTLRAAGRESDAADLASAAEPMEEAPHRIAPRVGKVASSLVHMIENMPEDMALELFDRPAVKAALVSLDGSSIAEPDVADAAAEGAKPARKAPRSK